MRPDWWRIYPATEVRAAPGSDVRRQIGLHQAKFGEQPVFRDVVFIRVEIVRRPPAQIACADLARFKYRVLIQLALNAQRPRLRIQHFDVRIINVNRVRDRYERCADQWISRRYRKRERA